MNRIDRKFAELRKASRKGFVLYLTAGDPTMSDSFKIISQVEKAGVDILELGVPFSDPLADGPTIQRASSRSLKHRTSMKDVLNLVKRLRKGGIEVPLVIFTYYNPVLKYGLKRFISDCSDNGVDGALILDLPHDEAGEYVLSASEKDIKTIFLITPTTPERRIRDIVKVSSGFIYCVSRTGVTGARKDLSGEAPSIVKKIKRHTKLPVAVGFGISTAKQVKKVSGYCDAVVVGSAAVKKIEENINSKDIGKSVGRYVAALTKGLT
ncbi:MAG: tryptophan synthase subunit alpha [Candidatus Aureabacteria bacterium]|nr:tryptophan synthase subunit alpha [Candidatus Auribacterota bacterium]